MPGQRTPGKRVRERLVDGPQSYGARMRARRWEVFGTAFPDIGSMSVLDLGGTVEAWRRAQLRPRSVTVLNLEEPGTSNDPRLVPVTGDACEARRVLSDAGIDPTFDLVFSNSLIEHVGGHARRLAVAAEVAAIAPWHWVQTPNRYFPVEPHWLFPGMQFLPVGTKASLAASWPLSHTPARSREQGLEEVLWTELIGEHELRAYFPDSEVFRERVCGLTKSITAVRAPAGRARRHG